MSYGNAGVVNTPLGGKVDILRENKVTLYRLHPSEFGRVMIMPNLPNGLHEAELWRKKGYKFTPQELMPDAKIEHDAEGGMFLVPPGYKLESYEDKTLTNPKNDKEFVMDTAWRVVKKSQTQEPVKEDTPEDKSDVTCPECGQECASVFGLKAHMKRHKK